ncbi:GTP pyrophosphokinase [Agromyces chitinivorans]|uniref:GTP pyrophosphokinase n=1 Tax=Agromyces chitinivorans TaxID=3158560 RepID=UPI003F519225
MTASTSGPDLDSAAAAFEGVDDQGLQALRSLQDEFARFMQRYKFGIDEIVTKLTILREDFARSERGNPIEHISSRLKSADSIVEKIQRKGVEPSFEAIREQVTDIAGVRVTCSFVSDVYRVFDVLTSQSDVRVVRVKDYIADPKANGYQSLHAIIEVPIFLSDGIVPVLVEVQFRTIAMDFWASLEHKIYYKYDAQVPAALLEGLKEAADTAARLDADMERLHHEVHGGGDEPAAARGERAAARGERAAEPVPDATGDAIAEVLPGDRAVRALHDYRARTRRV